MTIFGLDAGAVGEREHDAVAVLLHSRQAVAEMNGTAIEPARKRIKQIGAVKREIRRAIPSAAL